MHRVIFIDTEVNPKENRVLDYGAAVDSSICIHTSSKENFGDFLIKNTAGMRTFACGHNLIRHDAQYIREELENAGITEMIDTLYLSPLLFPNKPYHKLLKDDKLQTDELNNPLSDAIKAMELLYDEVNAFEGLTALHKDIYADLLGQTEEFRGFFSYLNHTPHSHAPELIRILYHGKICDNSDLELFSKQYPIELAYVLAMLDAEDSTSILPGWVTMNFPAVFSIIKALRATECAARCFYCKSELNIHKRLKQFFGYDNFRTYDGESLQEQAVQAAVDNKSILAIFPTGGGKSITFQLPALIAGATTKALTVVISPLQSLMKDQVDNLERQGIADAVTINGLLDPIERAEAIERVESGLATLLYISPESLRSKTVERLFLKRHIARFVIDEAHCFSAWGQDFRVDYLYIGKFIRELQEKKRLDYPIPVSCFTATAKQKVISDIREYFKDNLDLDIELFSSSATRKNLRYEVICKGTDEEKYTALRWLIEQKNCPTIVYVSRTKRTDELAQKLSADGFGALPFHGKMEKQEKQTNQDAFIADEVQVMVATSAFGMGVDKPNVKLVVHYDISDSLENYVQEAGRAGRDQNLQAECYVLFSEDDLDKHFIRLNQTKVSFNEIQQIWTAIKRLTKSRPILYRSPLEIARQAGWNESAADLETRVKTAVQALENAGYVERGKNMPHVYATGILVKNMMEGSDLIQNSHRMDETDRTHARRILSMLISKRSIANAGNDDAESRVDYISDRLGLEREQTFRLLNILREDEILADTKDLSAYILKTDTENKSLHVLRRYSALEDFLLQNIRMEGVHLNLKELNDKAIDSGIKQATVNALKTIFYYWTIRQYIEKSNDSTTERTIVIPLFSPEELLQKKKGRIVLAEFIIKYLFEKTLEKPANDDHVITEFSMLELMQEYKKNAAIDVSDLEVKDALLYLSKIDAMQLEGGFFVLYNSMQVKRLERDNKIRYKHDDYIKLSKYYRQKMQQIHIVGEYAKLMGQDYDAALQYVDDYFQMDQQKFIAKYFKGDRKDEISRNITPAKYDKLFRELSETQRAIIDDDSSKYIVVAAGPGSGKTKVLVHKLASLVLLEDVKLEQLLMLTFSRAAATEFRKRLYDLIGNAAGYIEIKTFHSYCFDLLGRVGNLKSADTVVEDATAMILNGEAETGRITKTVLVIDEAQDMDEQEFALVSALIERNDDLRVIAVGDDDQNIYQFRGSSSKYFESFLEKEDSKKYELLDNYRSAEEIVSFANDFVKHIGSRLKSAPIVSKRGPGGCVVLTRCTGRNLEEPVAKKAVELQPGGTVCILTTRNSEATRVVGLLKKQGVHAKLIQSNEGFDLYNLIEIRYFLLKLAKGQSSPLISDDKWESAKQDLASLYGSSSNLPLCQSILEAFELANPKGKYQSDFEIFLHESKIEDFASDENGAIVVSTIHKSKGREFDEVILMLDRAAVDSDEAKRALYVGMTRAKNGLYLFYNGTDIERLFPGDMPINTDPQSYEPPDEILLQLTHRDVHLGFFKDHTDIIKKIVCGSTLLISGQGLSTEVRGNPCMVVKFSGQFTEEIKKQAEHGYYMCSAEVRYIVGWTDTDEGCEYPIILPNVYFCRKKS